MKTTLTSTIFLLTTILLSCNSSDEKPNEKNTKNVPVATCATFWADYMPETSVKSKLVQSVLDGEHELSDDNKRFLKDLLSNFYRTFHPDTLLSTLDQPIYPIYRLQKDHIGIIGFYDSENIKGPWEGITKENAVLKNNYSYQSFDSVGKLCCFPEEFSALFNDAPPATYVYSLKRQGKSRVTNLRYMGNDCLSYFQYDFSLSKEHENDSIVFGSKHAIDLEFGTYPEVDRAFPLQYAAGCMDCPTNYPDQKSFAKLKGVDNIYFTYADDFPLNTKLSNPSRSIVYLDENGKVFTLWTVELDLSGCGCL